MTNFEIIKTYFELVNTGRWDEYLALFADDATMDEQLLGRIEGKESLRKAIEPLRLAVDFRNNPLQIIVDGNKGVAIWRLKTVSANGSQIECTGANYYEIVEGKIKYFANYHDTRPFEK